MLSRVFSGVLAGLAMFWAGAAPARADERGPDGQSLDRILPEIREHHPGRFYDAQGPMLGADGQLRYRIKWLTPDGRIVWFDVDAHTGRVLGPDANRREFAPPGTFDRPVDRPVDRPAERPDERGGDRGGEMDNRRPRFDNDGGAFRRDPWPDRGAIWRDRGDIRPRGGDEFGRRHY